MRRLIETEGYRVFDPATSQYHAMQTHNVGTGRLAFVMQNQHGVGSLMLVCGSDSKARVQGLREHVEVKLEEFTILIRDVL